MRAGLHLLLAICFHSYFCSLFLLSPVWYYIHSRLDVVAEDVEGEAGAAVFYGHGFQIYAVGYQLPRQENGGGAVEDVIAGISCISVAGQKTDIWYFSLCLSAGFSLAQ